MEKNRTKKTRWDVDSILRRIRSILRALEKIIEGEEELDFGEIYADLVGLMQHFSRCKVDKEIRDALNTTSKALAARLAHLFRKIKQNRKVRLIKIRGSHGLVSRLPLPIIGLELAPPLLGERYLVIRERGTLLCTSPVTSISDRHIRTRNSVYQIEVLNTAHI
jgi:hypothetical protein